MWEFHSIRDWGTPWWFWSFSWHCPCRGWAGLWRKDPTGHWDPSASSSYPGELPKNENWNTEATTAATTTKQQGKRVIASCWCHRRRKDKQRDKSTMPNRGSTNIDIIITRHQTASQVPWKKNRLRTLTFRGRLRSWFLSSLFDLDVVYQSFY